MTYDPANTSTARYLANLSRQSAAQPQPATPAPASRRWYLLLAILILVPVAVIQLPRELIKWQLAAGLEHRLEGDLAAAIRCADLALERDPDYLEAQVMRAQWKQDAGDRTGALADCNAIVARHESDVALTLRAHALQQLGRHDEAVADYEKVLVLATAVANRVRSTAGDLAEANALNGLAYAQALANQDLDDALVNIDTALDIIDHTIEKFRRSGSSGMLSQWFASAGRDLRIAQLESAKIALLDTRGFVYFRRGEWERADADMQEAIARAEDLKLLAFTEVDPRYLKLQRRDLRHSLAVIRYHGALVQEALGNETQAARNLARVRELGEQPGEHLF